MDATWFIARLFCVFILCTGTLKSEQFVFLTMLYNETDPQRIHEYKQCLQYNKQHPLIGEMHVFYDTSKDDDTNELLTFLKEQDIAIEYISERATYGQFFMFANQAYPNRTIIVSNADIYFDETLHLLETFDLTETLLTITRWNVLADGSKEVTKNYFTKQDDPGSHDTWIFKTPFPCIKESDQVSMGIMGCDGKIAYLAYKSGIKLINPCYSVHCLHLHLSPVRHYWSEKRYKGPLLNVPCTQLPKSNKKSRLVVNDHLEETLLA